MGLNALAPRLRETFRVNRRSLCFRLIMWYAGLLIPVMLCFAVYTHKGLEYFVQQVLTDALSHRARQIAQTLLVDAAKTGESYVTAQISIRYAPEVNDRFIRITRADGILFYRSGPPADQSFDPGEVPVQRSTADRLTVRQEELAERQRLLIVSLPYQAGDDRYLVEVGGSLAASRRVLSGLDLTLAAGLTVVIGIVIFGGYLLMKRALRPVQNLMTAAQEITLHHLSRRLPVRASGDEIESLARTLNQMIARLDESFAQTNRFTADASHELRTPLTIIRGELEALLFRENITDDMRAALASLLEEVERLVKIVEGLFALSRLDAGEAQTERVRLDLAKLAETTAEQMCLLAEEKEITLSYETGDAVEVEGDRSRLKQVVVNLLDNAIKYTPPHGRITLIVRAEDGHALMEVRDTGPGIPEAALGHLFERFYRADEVRSRDIGGAGLGLSIVHSICQAHGGTVEAKNVSPSGSSFTIRLPRVR